MCQWYKSFENTVEKEEIAHNEQQHSNRKKKEIKNLLVPNGKSCSFHIWHVASSSDILPKKKESFKNLLVPNRKV